MVMQVSETLVTAAPVPMGNEQELDALDSCHREVLVTLRNLTRLIEHLDDNGPDEAARPDHARDIVRFSQPGCARAPRQRGTPDLPRPAAERRHRTGPARPAPAAGPRLARRGLADAVAAARRGRAGLLVVRHRRAAPGHRGLHRAVQGPHRPGRVADLPGSAPPDGRARRCRQRTRPPRRPQRLTRARRDGSPRCDTVAMQLTDGLLLAGAALGAGLLNAIAGGGSFLTFPALVFAGLPPIAANATSAVAVSPATSAACWASATNWRGCRARAAARGADLRRRWRRRGAAAAGDAGPGVLGGGAVAAAVRHRAVRARAAAAGCAPAPGRRHRGPHPASRRAVGQHARSACSPWRSTAATSTAAWASC